MGEIKFNMNVDEKLKPVELTGGKTVSSKPTKIWAAGEKLEGILGKVQSLFRNPERKAQKESQYYLTLIKREPENIAARLKLAEIYLKRGEKRKATSVYLQTAEILSRNHLYPQAIAIYKRIQKYYPFLWQVQVYPKFAEICRKMELREEDAAPLDQEMEEIISESMELEAAAIRQTKIEESPAKRLQDFPKTAKALEENDGSQKLNNIRVTPLLAQGEKGAFFNRGAQRESIRPPESGEAGEVAMEKPYGFEEILNELRKIDASRSAYPDFHFHMGVACREMGLIDEAIEEFDMALEAGQKPFDAVHLLGLCFLKKERPQEARRLFQEALKVEGIPKEKIMEVELALSQMREKKEERPRVHPEGKRIGGGALKESSPPQDRKRQLLKVGSRPILPR